MKALGKYDADLQMFVEAARSADLNRLVYLRWLAERGLLEHEPFSAPQGEYAVMMRQLVEAVRCA